MTLEFNENKLSQLFDCKKIYSEEAKLYQFSKKYNEYTLYFYIEMYDERGVIYLKKNQQENDRQIFSISFEADTKIVLSKNKTLELHNIDNKSFAIIQLEPTVSIKLSIKETP